MARLTNIGAILGGCMILAACQSNPLKITRSFCPAVALVKHANSGTWFTQPVASAQAIDLTAQIYDLESNCAEDGALLRTDVSAVISAQRREAGPARSIDVPYFVAISRDGDQLLSKQLKVAQLTFAEGQVATSTAISVSTTLDSQIARDAAEPLKPEEQSRGPIVVETVTPPTAFEVLLGFQLSYAQAHYNLTR